MKTQINGIPCYVAIDHTPGLPFRQHGCGAGDCHPEEPEEFNVLGVYDDAGERADWLRDTADDADWDRIYNEYMTEFQECEA